MSALLPLEAIEMNLCAEYGYSSRTFQKFPNVPQSNDYRSCLFLVYTQANAINNRIPKYRNHFTLFRNEDTLIICRTETTIRYEDNDAVITYEIIKPLDEIDQRYRSTYNNWIVSFDKITYSSLFPSLIGFTLVCSGEWWFFDRGIILNGKTSYVANEDVESMFIYYEKHVNYTLTMPSNDTLLSMPPIFSAKSARTINNLVPVNETTEPMSIIQNINETNLLASSQQQQQQPNQQIHSKQQQQQDEPNQQIIQNNQSQQQFRARPLPQPQSQQQSAELYASLLNQLSNIANSTTVPQATTTSNASTSGLFNPEPPSVDIFTPQLPRNLQNSTLLLEQTQEISTSNIPAPESQTSQLLSSSTNTQLSAPPQPPTPISGIQLQNQSSAPIITAESTNQSQSTLTTNIQYQQQQQQQPQPQPQPQQQQYPLNNNTTTRLNNSIAQFTMSTLPSGILPYMNGVARPTIQENDTTTPPIVETTAVIPALHWFDERSNELYRGNIEYFRPIDYNGCRRVSKVLARKF